MCGKHEIINYVIVAHDPVNNCILSSPGDLAVVERHRNGKFSKNGKLGHSCVSDKGQAL